MSNQLVTVRYLQLDRAAFAPKRVAREGVTFSCVDPPLGELNRSFYTTIGGNWFWVDRRDWSAAQWSAHVSRPELTTWVLAVDGIPAGYVEFERRGECAIELAYVGLLPAFIGQGLGAHLVTCGIETALAMGATNVLVETCNLDHPNALANYVARGFRELRSRVKSIDRSVE